MMNLCIWWIALRRNIRKSTNQAYGVGGLSSLSLVAISFVVAKSFSCYVISSSEGWTIKGLALELTDGGLAGVVLARTSLPRYVYPYNGAPASTFLSNLIWGFWVCLGTSLDISSPWPSEIEADILNLVPINCLELIDDKFPVFEPTIFALSFI